MTSRRMITSDIWEDDFFTSLNIFERLLWVGLITGCADDQGRLQDNPALIRSKVFPIDDVSIKQIDEALNKYSAAAKIARYIANGKKVIQIINWWKHQTPRWAGKSNYPAPEGWLDKERYHAAGNEIITKNWELQGGYIASYIAGNTTNDVNGDVKGDDDIKGDGDGESSASAPKPAELEKQVLDYWRILFPNKPQPKEGTYRKKIATRFMSDHFQQNWQAALDKASLSATCQNESWFDFEFFVRNDENYQKMLSGWMDWKDRENYGQPKPNGNGAGKRMTTEERIAAAFGVGGTNGNGKH